MSAALLTVAVSKSNFVAANKASGGISLFKYVSKIRRDPAVPEVSTPSLHSCDSHDN